MSNKHRQRIVAALGLIVAWLGLLLRFAIFNTWSYKYLSMISTFGRDRSGMWGSPSVQVSYEVFSNIAMALVYAGIVLIMTSVISWLFMSPQNMKDEKETG